MKCFGNRTENFIIKLVLLDDQEIIQEVQRTSRGQELLDNVFRHLNIIETAYFGLRYIDNYGQPHWLDGSKSVIKQILESRTLYFGVKFYAADPCKLIYEYTRYQFFLQIKKDILQGRLTVNQDLAAELGAYSVQSELGDYDPRRHVPGYVSEFRFIANQSAELEAAIGELHKNMIGQVPAVSELNYLEKVKWLDMYGVDLHPVLGEDKIDYFLGLTPSAIIVLRNKTKVGNYFWPRITKLSMKGKYFMVRVKGREEQTYGFETPSKSACKHLWKSASEHHTFFRLVQVTPTPHANKSFTLGSRFRDSRSSDSSARRRAQPQFIRTPSRKYTRRYVEGADTSQHGQQQQNSELPSKSKDWTAPTPVSLPPLNLRDPSSPRSTRSVHIASRKYNVPSPRSSRSAHVSYGHRRSQSVESNSSVESSSRRHSRRRHKKKSSDAESEASTRSNKKRYRHRRSSGSDSEPCRHKRTHNNEPVRWKEATMTVPVVQSISNVVDLNNKENGGGNNTQTRSKRRSSHMRKKENKYISEELKKHLDFELIDTSGMTFEERRRIGYKQVGGGHGALRQPSGHPASGQEPKQQQQNQQQNQMHLAGESPPPPYSTTESLSEIGGPSGQTFGLPSSNCLASSSHSISSYTSAVHSKESNTPQHPQKRLQQQQQQQQQQQHHQKTKGPQSGFSYEISQSPTLSNNLKNDPFVHENSDSGLGTDREYYRGENMSSLSYALSLTNGAAPQPQHPPQTSTNPTYNSHRDHSLATSYWNSLKGDPGCDADMSHWGHPSNNHQGSNQDHFDGSKGNGRPSQDLYYKHGEDNSIQDVKTTVVGSLSTSRRRVHPQNSQNPQNSLELILSPLVSSTRTRL